MIYTQTIIVDENTAKRIRMDLQPDADLQHIWDFYGCDYTESYSVKFENGYEADVKICCTNFGRNQSSNPLWTEAVLFNPEGGQENVTDVDDKFFQDWELFDDDDNKYVIHIKIENNDGTRIDSKGDQLNGFKSKRIDWISEISNRLRDNLCGDIWGTADELLCKTEAAANTLAELIEQLYLSQGEEVIVNTGYYDPEEDKRNGEEDRLSGWWYVNIV